MAVGAHPSTPSNLRIQHSAGCSREATCPTERLSSQGQHFNLSHHRSDERPQLCCRQKSCCFCVFEESYARSRLIRRSLLVQLAAGSCCCDGQRYQIIRSDIQTGDDNAPIPAIEATACFSFRCGCCLYWPMACKRLCKAP